MEDNKVIKAGFGYTIGNYLLKGLSFLTVPIFARLLSTEDFGIYSTFIAYETILFIILGVALHSSYKNAKYRYEPGAIDNLTYNGYVSATFLILAVNTAVLLILANVLCEPLSRLLKLDRLSINLLILYSFAIAAVTCYNTDMSLRYSYKSYLIISGINAVSSILLSIALILTIYKNQRYMGRIVGTVIPIFLIAVYIGFFFLRREKPSQINSYLKWGLGFSFPIVFHGISQVILSQFDRIMIRDMSGDAAVGIYSFGYTIFSIINVTFNSTDSVWTTWFYEKLNQGEEGSIRKRSDIYIYFVLILCVGLMLICPEVIDIIGAGKYYEARYCTVPIIASGFFVFLYTLPSSIEYFYEKTRKIAFATIIAALLNVILNYIFIRQYGYVAAAYTTLFTYILYFLFHYFQARKIYGKDLFSKSTIVISSVSVMLCIPITFTILEYPLVRWPAAILVLAIYIIYEERETGIIREVIKRIKKAK